MAAAGDGWRDKLKEYFRSIENLSEQALKTIKQDRARNQLPFDDSFKDFILKMANARIVYVYTNLMYEEMFEDEQNLPNQSINHQNDENVPVNFQQQLATMTINPEHIEQMPIILVQSNNQNSTSNAIDNTTSVRDGNRLSDQIIISIPSNQLPIPSEVEIEQNPEDGLLPAQSNGMELPGVSVVDEPLTVSNPLRTIGDGMIMETTPTNANDLQQMENSNEQPARFETIDLTSDQEDEKGADTMISGRNERGQTQPNVERQEVSKNISITNNDNAVITHKNKQFKPVVVLNRISYLDKDFEQRQNVDGEPNERQEVSNVQHARVINCIVSDQQESVHNGGNTASKSIDNVGDQSQSTVQHQKSGKDRAMISENLKKLKRFKCDDCDYSTNYKWHLDYHIRTHTGERPYECDVCEKRFIQKIHLNRHMKTHRDMFPFQCSNCRQGFANRISLNLHESRCKAKGYECHLCKIVLLRKEHLVGHMRTHTGDKLRCSKCRKQFSFKSNLKLHMKMHGKLFRFQCSNCRQGFSDRELWKSHENRCKAKQFECYLCSKKFYQGKSHFLVHMRHKHTGEKPFGCFDCPKRFCQKSNLTRHIKRKHKRGN